MKRKEEREHAAIAFQDSPAEDNINTIADFFICGAEWADKTMLDKVCEWLRCNLPYSSKPPYQLIEDLRKEMEE